MKAKKAPGGMSFYIILLAVIILLSIFMSQAGRAEETTLSDILTRINSGEISLHDLRDKPYKSLAERLG